MAMLLEEFSYPIQTIVHNVKVYDIEEKGYLIQIRGNIVNLDTYLSEKRYNDLENELRDIVATYLNSEYEKKDNNKVRVFTNEIIKLKDIKKDYDEDDFYNLKVKYGVDYTNLSKDKSTITLLGLNYIDENDKVLYIEELKRMYL